MKSYSFIAKFLLIVVASFTTSMCFAKSKEKSSIISLRCETKSQFFSYADNASYIKDQPLHTKALYSEKFIIDFLSSDRAIKKHANDMIEDEEFSIIKAGSVYELKSIKKADDISVVIDLQSGKYSSIAAKQDAMIRIKATGNCVKNE